MGVQSTVSGLKRLPDLAKLSEGFLVEMLGGVAQAAVFGGNADGITVANPCPYVVRGTITWDADVNATGDNTFLVPPGGSVSLDFQDIDVADDTDPVVSVEFEPVAPTGAAGATAASALANAGTDDVYVVVNVIES